MAILSSVLKKVGREAPLRKVAAAIRRPYSQAQLVLFDAVKPRNMQKGLSTVRVFEDELGSNWLFKTANDRIRHQHLMREHVAHRVGRVVDAPISEGGLAEIGKEQGFIQEMFPNAQVVSAKLGPKGNLNKLSTQQANDVMQAHVFDTLISNTDVHRGNFVFDAQNRIRGIDKGFAFGTKGEKLSPGPGTSFPHEVGQALAKGTIPGAESVVDDAMNYAVRLSKTSPAALEEAIEPLYARGSIESQQFLERARNLPQIYEEKLSQMMLKPGRSSSGRAGGVPTRSRTLSNAHYRNF